jgi:hypothetical protein
MASEVREILRRALLVALGLLIAIPAAVGILLLNDKDGSGLWVAGGSVAAFFVGRALINWIFLKS